MKKLRRKVYMAAGYNTISLGTGRKEFHPKKPRPGLEKYIKENRKAFDDKRPPEDAWHNINDQLDNNETRVVPISTYFWRAAAILLFAAVIWLLVDRSQGNDTFAVANGFINENEIAFKEAGSDVIRIINKYKVDLFQINQEGKIKTFAGKLHIFCFADKHIDTSLLCHFRHGL